MQSLPLSCQSFPDPACNSPSARPLSFKSAPIVMRHLSSALGSSFNRIPIAPFCGHKAIGYHHLLVHSISVPRALLAISASRCRLLSVLSFIKEALSMLLTFDIQPCSSTFLVATHFCCTSLGPVAFSSLKSSRTKTHQKARSSFER